MRDLITNDKPQTENLEVVLLKNGKTELSAVPEDFRRVPVVSTGPLQAIMCDEVAKVAAEGYSVLYSAQPGVLTGPEVLARQRSLEGTPIDRSKI
jgi:hypothetical protein